MSLGARIAHALSDAQTHLTGGKLERLKRRQKLDITGLGKLIRSARSHADPPPNAPRR